MIVILDYGMGNVGSIKNMLIKLKEKDVQVTADFEVIRKADKMILPGVGAFDKGIENIINNKLDEAIFEHVLIKNKPLLGICLGMQLLGESSEEGRRPGLGLIPFKNVKFSNLDKLKVPHMGWNYVNVKIKEDPLTRGLVDNERFYFVHSYHAKCKNEDNVLMTCSYGEVITAAVKKNNIYGVQFHPEKSHKYGMKLLNNFVLEV